MPWKELGNCSIMRQKLNPLQQNFILNLYLYDIEWQFTSLVVLLARSEYIIIFLFNISVYKTLFLFKLGSDFVLLS